MYVFGVVKLFNSPSPGQGKNNVQSMASVAQTITFIRRISKRTGKKVSYYTLLLCFKSILNNYLYNQLLPVVPILGERGGGGGGGGGGGFYFAQQLGVAGFVIRTLLILSRRQCTAFN